MTGFLLATLPLDCGKHSNPGAAQLSAQYSLPGLHLILAYLQRGPTKGCKQGKHYCLSFTLVVVLLDSFERNLGKVPRGCLTAN